MEIVGKVNRLFEKSNSINKRKKIIVEVYDSLNDKSIWEIEFRSKIMYAAAQLLSMGDHVKITCFNQGRIDNHNNHYNNVIAKEIIKL